ncbi:SacI domain-containingand endonuclease/exonuclease/phosphatase family protein [Purpureocillium lavendulum]|uniref:SacI domain-containingand endonuclease/exonuclease/phosphatase family protein n=1 Tax=Purpureocillium lavendulum TaxID=1247861 RepID=A0AB34G404_9HYPO|nr:SacI domain-containingand endonuclease/exonuclease/phosphatase family protein [Purpureocillium lavendulum]
MLGASRILATGTGRALAARPFSTSARRMADAAAPLPARKPMGAFRGGLFGFLFGCVLSGGAVYSYVLNEYKTSNELLTEDIYTLQASVTRLTNYVKNLEERTQARK